MNLDWRVNAALDNKTLHVESVLIEPHYLPCIAYFSSLVSCSRVILEKHEHYEKQSFRNRCYIKGPHRVETLVVPVTGKGGKTPLSEVRIDHSQKWLNNHWRTIQTAYGNAPFFEYYGPEIHDILYKKHGFLCDLNQEFMTLCLNWLKIKASLHCTDNYQKVSGIGIIDLRGVINPKKEQGCNRIYKRIEYGQVFGSNFVHNLSIIDLIFNRGPESGAIVRASAAGEQ